MSVFKLIALALLSLTALAACSKSSSPETSVERGARPEIPVIAELLILERQRVRIEAVGTSRARLSAELYPLTSGKVVAVNFQPGQAVKAGDALVELDKQKESVALRLAELQLLDAERLYDRYQRSADSGAVLPTVMDAARTAVEIARLEVESARIALQDRTVEAVFDGYVGSSEIDPGDRIDTSTLITTLDDRSSLLVNFAVPEAFIGELAVGDAVQMETWSDTQRGVAGQIIDIASRIDPGNRTFDVRARVENSADSLRPGMSFRVTVDVQGDLYAAVAETSLQWGADGAYVWSVVDGRAQRVPVQVVQRRDCKVLVDGDLDESTVVVVEGTQSIRDGAAVSHDIPRVATSKSLLNAD
ncbi:MAG: efflux RND transporter periplasmic adaptor subunit [Woeseiaceae bacterium]